MTSLCTHCFLHSVTERGVLECLLTSMEEYTDQLEADYLEEKMKTEQLLYQLLPRYTDQLAADYLKENMPTKSLSSLLQSHSLWVTL